MLPPSAGQKSEVIYGMSGMDTPWVTQYLTQILLYAHFSLRHAIK
jgi:hypothetical protein